MAWSDKPFPPLIAQFRNWFEGRIAIDEAVSNALWKSSQAPDLTTLYDTLATRLEWLGNLLTKD